jgi:hypothetical protein
MRKSFAGVVVTSVIGTAVGWLSLAACGTVESEPAAKAPFAKQATKLASTARSNTSASQGDGGIVVLELFTSQGCSSCPPADRLLSSLAAAGALGERNVVPMAFHVDYWNDLGWSDPFSSPAWSQRQREYASALGEDGVYTPQLVIGGRAHVVGSDRRKIEGAVAAAQPARPLQVRATWTARSVTVHAPADAGTGELWLALWQDGLFTEVGRGENRGERLRSQHVVRRLVRLERGTATVAIDPSWKAGLALGGLVFEQRDSDRAIVAAGELPPPQQ